MSTADTYSARRSIPELIERGVSGVLSCPMYRAGALVAPSSGTVTVLDASGAEAVSAAAVTVAGSIATYTWAPPSTLTLGERWRVSWALVMPDGITHTVVVDAALVRRRLYCPITEADLYRVESALDPAGAAPLTSLTNYVDKIDEAWTAINLRLIAAGNRPNLIVDSSALRQAALMLALAMAFADVGSRVANPAHTETSGRYMAAYEVEWSRIRLIYDEGDTASAEDGRRAASNPTIWTGGWRPLSGRIGW